MSWNEPGGGKGPRDPWGGKDQGPPDLDEALRKLQDQLNGLFGGRSSGGSGKSGRGAGGLLSIAAIAVHFAEKLNLFQWPYLQFPFV